MGPTLLDAALAAADRGFMVFPLVPGRKVPAIRDWQNRATTDKRQIYKWWSGNSRKNPAIACGASNLVVLDLDDGRGERVPTPFTGAAGGAEVLAMLAERAAQPAPWDTYTVSTPTGRGLHLYFHTPPTGPVIGNSAGRLGWKLDVRAGGGYVLAPGARVGHGAYRVVNNAAILQLPAWLVTALAAPPSPSPPVPEAVCSDGGWLPARRARAYVAAIVCSETTAVATAPVGTRHHRLLAAARTLGQLAAAGELDAGDAAHLLDQAAATHVGVEAMTAAHIRRDIADGLAYGAREPRRITRRQPNEP